MHFFPIIALTRATDNTLNLALSIRNDSTLCLRTRRTFCNLLSFRLNYVNNGLRGRLTLTIHRAHNFLKSIQAGRRFRCTFLIRPDDSSGFFATSAIADALS